MFNIYPSAWIFLILWLKVFRYLEKKWKIACEQRSNSIGVLTESQLNRAIVWASKTTGFSNFQRELLQEIQRIGVLSKLRQWNSCCSHAIFHFFSKYSMTFNLYNLNFQNQCRHTLWHSLLPNAACHKQLDLPGDFCFWQLLKLKIFKLNLYFLILDRKIC